MEKVIRILMERDGMTREEAIELIEDTKSEILDSTNVLEADEIIECNLGLEPDYIFDILCQEVLI